MVLSGSANKRLIAAFNARGLSAVGISGEDARMLTAEPIDAERFGRAGKPVGADTRLIETLLAAEFLPVISPLATDSASEHGAALNVNGDDAAAAIAASLGAELWLVSDVEGVMLADGTVLPDLDVEQMTRLVTDGIVNSGMHAKLEAGFAALNAGCPTVRICSLDAFASEESGTHLSLTPSFK